MTTYFNVTTTPVGIVSISPYHAPQSTTLNVEIVGLNTHFAAGTTQVHLRRPQITVNSVTVNSADRSDRQHYHQLHSAGGVLTPTPPGWNSVYINTGAEHAHHRLLSGCSGHPDHSERESRAARRRARPWTVTITGSLTNWVQGQTEAILGAGVTVANLTITSPTTATATISVSPRRRWAATA